MFERFTVRSRKVLALANQEAHRFNHEFIGTEHILLGMIKEGSGVGVTVLKNLGVDTQSLWHEVERLVKRGPDRVTMGKLPQTPRAKKVIEYAIKEMREMEEQFNRRLNVGTEHILLGLLRESEGIAAQVLMILGLRIEQVRSEVLALEGKKEPLMEREPRTWEDKGENKLLIKREGSGAINQYERFTDRARKVMELANQEAQRFNHEYIGTEHILLGLVKEGSGVGATVLKQLDVDIKKLLRFEVEKLHKCGPDMVTIGKLPQTPRAKKVIEYAIEEARSLKHDYVATEHILLGLLVDSEGLAAQVLVNLGFQIERVRREVLMLCGIKKDYFINDYHAANQKPKSEGQKSRAIKVHTIPESVMIWVKCTNPVCKAEYQTSKKGYFKYIEEHVNPMTPTAPAMTCEKCGEQSIFRAEKCTNSTCGNVFIRGATIGAVPEDFPDRCPECGHSEIEEIRSKRSRGSK